MNDGKIILYRTDDGKAALSLYARDGSVWMNQAQLAELFATSVPNISMHISSVLQDKELSGISVVKNYLTTAADGKEYIHLLRLNKTERGKTVTLKRANGEAFGVRQQALIITHKSQGRDLVVRREARNERHAAFASRRMVQTTERPRPPRRPHAPVAQRGAYKAVSRSFLACHRTTRSSHAFCAAFGVTALCRGAVAPLPLVGNGEGRLPHSTALRGHDCHAGAYFREKVGGRK